MKYFADIKCATVTEAISSSTPILAALKRSEGEDFTRAILVKYLKDVITFFNIGKSMENAQVAQTVDIIIQQYYFLKLADIKLCFENLKTGKYGKLFDRLDGQIILMALSEYCEERMSVAEVLHIEANKTNKQDNAEYLVKVGENYVRENGNDFEEVETKELATCFDFNKAFKIKSWLIKEHYSKDTNAVKMVFNTPDIGLIDRLLKDKPDLVDAKTKWQRTTASYYEQKKAIENDNGLSEFEKHNAIRKLAGLESISFVEYAEYLKELNQ